VASRGGGIAVFDSTVTVANTILWGNRATVSGPAIWVGLYQGTFTLDISYFDVEGGRVLVMSTLDASSIGASA